MAGAGLSWAGLDCDELSCTGVYCTGRAASAQGSALVWVMLVGWWWACCPRYRTACCVMGGDVWVCSRLVVDGGSFDLCSVRGEE